MIWSLHKCVVLWMFYFGWICNTKPSWINPPRKIPQYFHEKNFLFWFQVLVETWYSISLQASESRLEFDISVLFLWGEIFVKRGKPMSVGKISWRRRRSSNKNNNQDICRARSTSARVSRGGNEKKAGRRFSISPSELFWHSGWLKWKQRFGENIHDWKLQRNLESVSRSQCADLKNAKRLLIAPQS